MSKQSFINLIRQFFTLFFLLLFLAEGFANDSIQLTQTELVDSLLIEVEDLKQIIGDQISDDIKEKEGLMQAKLANIIQVILLILQIIIILYGINQFKENLKYNRRENIYQGFIDLEGEISEENKEVWGLPKDNYITIGQDKFEYNLNELKHMVRLIDLFAFERGHSKKYDYSALPDNHVLYNLLKKPKYLRYWNYLIRPNFFENSRFVKVIENTVLEIDRQKNLNTFTDNNDE